MAEWVPNKLPNSRISGFRTSDRCQADMAGRDDWGRTGAEARLFKSQFAERQDGVSGERAGSVVWHKNSDIARGQEPATAGV